MATPKFDRIAENFLKLVPDKFVTAFVPGNGPMPNGYVLTSDKIIDYVNKGMMKLFNDKWDEAFKISGGDPEKQRAIFVSVFPELLKPSGIIGLPYIIGSESNYRDFFRIFGAVISDDNTYIRIWDEDKLTLVMSGSLIQYTPTANSPVIIPQNQLIQIFPSSIFDSNIKMQYIKMPINTETGESLTQDGSYDSPFYDHWTEKLAVEAYSIWLMDSQQTT